MEFPYIQIDGVIADLQGRYKEWNEQGKLDQDNMFADAVECIREIGGFNYAVNNLVLKPSRSAYILPKDFMYIQEAWELTEVPGGYTVNIAFKYASAYYATTKRIIAGNRDTLKYLHPSYRNAHCGEGANTYIVKSPPATLQLAHPCTEIGIKYWGLHRDESGTICMQDEVNSIKCVKAYMLLMAIKPMYLMGKISENVFRNFQSEYDQYLPLARNMMKLDSPEELDRQVHAQNNRYTY